MYSKNESKEDRRRRTLKYEYNITPEIYEEIYKRQEGGCAICGRKYKVLDIDHNHKTNKIRGLLCRRCNYGMGYLSDNTILIARMALYLLAHDNDLEYFIL